MTQVGIRLLRAFAEALQLPENAFDQLYGDKPNEHIKLIRYPGQQETQQPGVGAHKDSGFLSFLLQDEQKGLQVEVAPGEWIDAVPLAGSFVVNIGELLELATNGYLRATVHRVVSPPAQQQRLSIAFFLGAQLDAVVPVYTLPPELAREARGRTATRTIRCCAMSAGIISRAVCVPIRTWRNATIRTCFANAPSN